MRQKHISKTILTLFFIIIISLAFGISSVAAADQTKNNETLTIGVPRDRCPIFYEDSKTGEPTGIGIDLMRAVAENAGYAPVFRFVSENNLKEALDNTDYDVVMPFGSAIGSADGRTTVVSENLMQTPFTLVTLGRGELPPLNNLRVGMLRSLGGGIDTLHELFPGMEIVAFDTMQDSVKALRAGKLDALLHNSYVWSYVLQKPSYNDLTVQPSTVFSMDFRAGTIDTPEGRAIIERLNDGIDSMEDTYRQAVILDHTSRKLYKYDFDDYIHEYGLTMVLVILLIIALIIIVVQKMRAMRREQEEKMRKLIDHDPLTGVYSLTGFRKKVEELIRSHPDTPYFLSYNNIRDFKFINESLGRDAGDDLLKFWAARSMENLSDDEAMCRITADRFVILCHIAGEEQMLADERNIIEPVRNYFINRGKDVPVDICCGLYALTPEDFRSVDVDKMIDLAHDAEKRIRKERSVSLAYYNPEQWEKGRRAVEIANNLHKAIENGDIHVWYQPQINYDTGEIKGAEALCRWYHSKLGFLSPVEFIPTLEESGLIYDLDCFVWDRVCQDLKRWNGQGHHRAVSVNVSREDLHADEDIAGHFSDLITKYGLTSDQLRIEITESAYVDNPEVIISSTEKLRKAGFQVEMDDFGSGYSSLHMLKDVPVDRIKLDLHFLSGSGSPEKGRTIISCMIYMVHSLGMELIAEGVETIDQAKFLQSQGCPEMQGFYFYKPMPATEYEDLINEQTMKAKTSL